MADVEHTLRFQRIGITASHIEEQITQGDSVLSVVAMQPTLVQDVQILCDESVYSSRKDEIESAMAGFGYSALGEDLPALTAATIARRARAVVSTDLAAITGSWTDVLSASITTRGGTVLSIVASLSGLVVGNAAMRVRVSGGAYGAGTTIRGTVLDDARVATIPHPLLLAVTGGDTTYTATVQAQVTGGGSSLTINAATDPENCGGSLSLFEYV